MTIVPPHLEAKYFHIESMENCIGVYITEDELDDALDKFDGHLLINIRIISYNEYMRGNYVIGMNKLITK